MGRKPTKTPEELRAAAAARSARYRERKQREEQTREQVAAYTDAIVGLGEPGKPAPPPPSVADKDLAKMVRERLVELFENMTDEELLDKDHKHIIDQMLKTATVFDRREAKQSGSALLEQGKLLLQLVMGDVNMNPQLPDPTVIEGDAREVE